MVGAGDRLVDVLSTSTEATCGVADASGVTEGIEVNVVVTSKTKGPDNVGLIVGGRAGAAVEVAGAPPIGVGVTYCPHRDVLPTQDAVIKETAINKAEIRLTLCPFRELYLY